MATATTTVATAAAAVKMMRKGSVVSMSVQRIRTHLGIAICSYQHRIHQPQQSLLFVSNYNTNTRNGRYDVCGFTCYCTATGPPQASTPPEAELSDSGEGGEDEKEKLKKSANLLDIRVGKIIKAWRHEEADSLYVEEVDVGEAEPRVICSGLVKYVPIEQLQDRKVIVLANLKPRNMRGVKSSGMLMAASDSSHENVELLEPPEDSVPGDRVWFGSIAVDQNLPSPASPNQIQKKKIWESVQPHLKTDDSCVAMLEDHLMHTSSGVVGCRSLKNASIS
ncbi:hypothetical protein K2173_019126 [Erythroxylum novogranatense]|uniref:tRNA-binding domain-containing protein n=1 Tax=Erythroxylum novogranatense TaxID=1862640 RepID=A0AAV8STQ2_9ROSI|nr:hypothetical protein K2173_019126 [Erythroxylum novogranatense]